MARTQQVDEHVKIPKDRMRTITLGLGLIIALGALILMAAGFVDAALTGEYEADRPAPEVVVPETLPE